MSNETLKGRVGLDVERLTEALHEVGVGCPSDKHWRPERHEPDWHALQAKWVAAEYDRRSILHESEVGR